MYIFIYICIIRQSSDSEGRNETARRDVSIALSTRTDSTLRGGDFIFVYICVYFCIFVYTIFVYKYMYISARRDVSCPLSSSADSTLRRGDLMYIYMYM